MADIFLSYATEDRERVRPLVERLEEHGWSVWWDREIPPGQTWPQMIEGALSATKAMIVVWSEASVKSKWVQIETTKGEQRGGLIPVAIDPVEAPLQFSLIQAADLTAWNHSADDQQLQKVIEQLEGILGVPTPAAELIVEREDIPTEHLIEAPRADAVEPTSGVLLSESQPIVAPPADPVDSGAPVVPGTPVAILGADSPGKRGLGDALVQAQDSGRPGPLFAPVLVEGAASRVDRDGARVGILFVDGRDGPMPDTRRHLALANADGLAIVGVLLQTDGVDDTELLELVELEIRELLGQYNFPGDDTLVAWSMERDWPTAAIRLLAALRA